MIFVEFFGMDYAASCLLKDEIVKALRKNGNTFLLGKIATAHHNQTETKDADDSDLLVVKVSSDDEKYLDTISQTLEALTPNDDGSDKIHVLTQKLYTATNLDVTAGKSITATA